MKRGTGEHAKMVDLAARLQVELPFAVGLMTFLWEWTAKETPAGNIGKYTNLMIAHKARWTGNADDFVNALVAAKWVDESEEHRLVIHDWWDHCEDSVHNALARHGLLFADGRIPKFTRLAKNERKDISQLYKAKQVNLLSALKRTKSALPLPSLSLNQAIASAADAASRFPAAAAAVTTLHPDTDSRMVEQIAHSATGVRPQISDSELEAVLMKTHKGKRQQSAALWLHTVPAYLEAEDKRQVRIRGDPTPKPPGLDQGMHREASIEELRLLAQRFRDAGLPTHAQDCDAEATALEAAIAQQEKGKAVGNLFVMGERG